MDQKTNKNLLNSVVIRKVIPSDADHLSTLRRDIISETKFLMETFEELVSDPVKAKKNIEELSKGKILLLAEHNSEVIGTISLGRHNFKKISHRGGIMMMVKSEFRGKGVGRKLLHKLLEEAKKDTSLLRIDISVMSENLPAIRLYQSLGFAIEGSRLKAFKFDEESFQDEIYMGLTLNY